MSGAVTEIEAALVELREAVAPFLRDGSNTKAKPFLIRRAEVVRLHEADARAARLLERQRR